MFMRKLVTLFQVGVPMPEPDSLRTNSDQPGKMRRIDAESIAGATQVAVGSPRKVAVSINRPSLPSASFSMVSSLSSILLCIREREVAPAAGCPRSSIDRVCPELPEAGMMVYCQPALDLTVRAPTEAVPVLMPEAPTEENAVLE